MNPKIILLVEDNPDDVDLTLLAFKKNHILNEVVVAHDGAEALELLFGDSPPSFPRRGVTPALILLDLNMPKVNGIEVLQRVRSSPATRLLPVVVLTSSREERDLIESYSLGCNSYIRKPVDFSQFIEATRQLGLYWLLLNEPPPAPR
jgi:two-component system response regulator